MNPPQSRVDRSADGELTLRDPTGNELQTRWQLVPFECLVENFDGRRIPLKQADRNKRTGQYPYYGASGVIDYIDDYLFDGEYLLIAEDGANLRARTTPIAFSAHGRFWVNNHAHVVRPKDGVLLDYLIYWFAQADISDYITGSAQPKLSQAKLNDILVPLPPLAEQRRIAAQLREELAEVAQARAAVEAQLEAAKLLPAALLGRVFQSAEAAAWPIKILGDVLRLRKEVVHPRNKPVGEAVFVGLQHIESQTDCRIGMLPLTMSQLTGRKPRFYAGDIVYGYLRPYLNKVWVAEFDGLCSVDQYVYEVSQDIADAYFIASFMRSPTYLQIAPIAETPGQLPRIRTEEVAVVPIPLPSLTEQRRIAARLREELAEVARARAAVEAQLAALKRLPAALLAQTFRGGS